MENKHCKYTEKILQASCHSKATICIKTIDMIFYHNVFTTYVYLKLIQFLKQMRVPTIAR